MRNKVPLIRNSIIAMIMVLSVTITASAQELAKFSETASTQKSMLLKDVLSEVEKKFNIYIVFDSKVVEDISVTEYSLDETNFENSLRNMLASKGLQLEKVRKDFFVISEKEKVNQRKKPLEKMGSSNARSVKELDVVKRLEMAIYSQERKISGKVTATDENEPLPGVNVIAKGTSVGTVTDLNGEYIINVPEGTEALLFSYVGYTPEEIQIENRSVIDVGLTVDLETLSEVVVVGYGSQERAEVTGAISSVSSKEIRALPVPRIDQALQGRAAGVTVTNDGGPGEGATVRIRGLGTVGDNDPLYVIDGVPAGGLNQINPNDIESIEILKDASAAAIYGSRAANGVILVTTKKGTAGKTKIAFDSYYGTQSVWKRHDLLNTSDYIDYATAIQQNANLPVPARFSEDGIEDTNIDYQDVLFRAAPIQDHNLTISGGNENSTFLVSGGYFNQVGTIIGTDFERYSFRLNSNHKIGKFNFGQTLTVAYSRQNSENGGGTNRSLTEHAIKSPPYQELRDPNNLGGFNGPDQVDNNDAENPLLLATLTTDQDDDLKLLGSAWGEYELFDGLKYKLLFGLDINMGYGYNYTPKYVAGDFHFTNFASLSEQRSQFISPLITNSLTYDKTFGKSQLTVLAAYERQTFNRGDLSAEGQNPLTNDIRVIDGLDAGSANIGGDLVEWALISYIGRINYDYDNKYLLTASIRRDGSSRFGPNNKFGIFPSVSLGWRMSEEPFMQNLDFLSELKLRASWGETGNQNIGDYQYIATINGNFNYNFNGNLQQGSTISALANELLQWETTIMRNVGFDAGLFDDKVTFSAEYFNNRTVDMLVSVPLAWSTGLDDEPSVNAGTVENSGFEFNALYRHSAGDFNFDIGGNIAFVRNEVISLGAGQPIPGPQFESDRITWTQVGSPIAQFYGWEIDGIFQSYEEIQNHAEQNSPFDDDGELLPEEELFKKTGPGDYRFVDQLTVDTDGDGIPDAGDGIINDEDRVILGNPFPDFNYGINAGASYKNFDLTLFIQGVAGNEIYNTQRYDLEGMTRVFNAGTAVFNRWRQPGDDTNMPRGISGDPNRNTRASARFIEDGSYLRLKNLSIGYTLPSSVLNNLEFLSRVRVYLSAQNLFTLTNYSGYDPEIGARRNINSTLGYGIDFGQTPQARTFLGGIQIDF